MTEHDHHLENIKREAGTLKAPPTTQFIFCIIGWAVGIGGALVAFLVTFFVGVMLTMPFDCVATLDRETGEATPIAPELFQTFPSWIAYPAMFILWACTGGGFGAGFGKTWRTGNGNPWLGLLCGAVAPVLIFAFQPWLDVHWFALVAFGVGGIVGYGSADEH
jgi:hypothetical protein